ncbi:hypothetical protein CEP88_02120 [Roseobacter denitrificans]|uniref:Lipoprotein n=1 Tax=Roseobacter denitrificans (strain ATCC 33942 / OCh 114) TaxID=375451 RepID=Q166U1_ROSDO|nr:hypothetical protein [Roseobacter denitrificans]ABG32002.1 hypothetical protein RD1_2436 [Roseobacter denitrificans OCh 114]AVL51533.1 hypothetical protein CEP88_02120 [Roseobacter denitrificans]SFG36108.1 hypothetical protein SAMN05443635_11469 [Roseobacter denitrificans OCh 114]
MPLARSIAALFILAITSACAAVTPRGVMEAARLDPLNTPPQELGLALSVPDTIVLKDGDAMVRLALSVAGEALVDARVPLSVQRAPEAILVSASQGEVIYAASLTPQNAAILAAAQAETRALRAAGTQGEGIFSIAVVGGCRTGDPLEALPVSTWLRTNPSASFVPLTRRMDVLDGLEGGGVMVPPCES